MKAQAESRQTLVLGVYAREFPGGLLKLDPAFEGYGNLAANNGPTSEKPFTNTISNQSCNYSKESVFRQFRTSPASHSWEALNNHMWPEKPIQTG